VSVTSRTPVCCSVGGVATLAEKMNPTDDRSWHGPTPRAASQTTTHSAMPSPVP